MKKTNPLILFFTLLLLALAVSNVCAQETVEEDNPRPVARPFKLLLELGLTREQIGQVRRINQTRRPIMQAAVRRWQTARRDLDAAIYADDSTEEQIKELTRAAMTAQAELLREKTLTEYLIRKVLTPEQLIKFRELRESLPQKVNERKNADTQDVQDNEPQRPVNRFQPRRAKRRQ